MITIVDYCTHRVHFSLVALNAYRERFFAYMAKMSTKLSEQQFRFGFILGCKVGFTITTNSLVPTMSPKPIEKILTKSQIIKQFQGKP